jgi:hypothetical protein
MRRTSSVDSTTLSLLVPVQAWVSVELLLSDDDLSLAHDELAPPPPKMGMTTAERRAD